ncbi:putative beta-lysine N-acetyltransferase [Paenibacillus silvisoli]|uniref:putative beta-lysine N-acetyltransferase n=1 Tax=Paenibacillus silvisoli TaxID=3110539 RepID=UPI002805A2B1|nr:putative beta-lysine N-acetyltransferase [Paenibacillus silvisoli]
MTNDAHDEQYYTMETIQENEFTLQLCKDPFNKRLRVDDYLGNVHAICLRLAKLLENDPFTKLFVKAREEDWRTFAARGYMLEGVYTGYFDGRDGYCMAKYTDLERRTSDHWIEEDRILEQVLELEPKMEREPLPDGFTLRCGTPSDAEELAALYGLIFQTYPIPMNDPAYVAHAMEEGTAFYVVEHENKLVSAASAEINGVYRNAEMTDCVTLPAYRGFGLMRQLLQALEEELLSRNIRTAYSLSRALSFGMNAVLAQLGYAYQGRLTKNCDIFDKFEDMNLWCKTLQDK